MDYVHCQNDSTEDLGEDEGIKTKLIFLNIFCLFAISLLCVLSWNQLRYSIRYFDNDYKTFYMTLHGVTRPYHENQYVRVLSMHKEKNGKAHLKTTPVLSAINMNSPTMSLLLKGLVNVSSHLTINVLLWVILSLWCAGLSIYFLAQWFDTQQFHFYFLPLLFLFLFSWPSLYTLKLGQVSFFVLPFLSLAFLLLTRKNYVAMTITLALVAALKLFFLTFALFFLLRRQWRYLLLFIFSFLSFFFLPLFYFSGSDYEKFFRIATHFGLFVNRAALPMNASLLGVIVNTRNFFHLQSDFLQIRIAVGIVVGYLIIRTMYSYDLLRRLPGQTEVLLFSLLIVLSLLCSPLGWYYYFIFFIIPFVVFLKAAKSVALPNAFFIMFACILFLPLLAWITSQHTWVLFLAHLACVASALCWFIDLHLVARAFEKAEPPAAFQVNRLFFICTMSAVMNIVLLLINYGMPYFFTLDQTRYLHATQPALLLR